MAITARHDNQGSMLSGSNINFAWLNGVTAGTDIAVTGIKSGDQIITAVEFDVGLGNDQSPIPITDMVIVSDGLVETTATNTTGSTIMMVWIAKTI